MYIPPNTTGTISTCCNHCWHTPNASLTIGWYPQRREEVCCHCGMRRWFELQAPPIPAGHGPHYPRDFGNGVPIWGNAAGPANGTVTLPGETWITVTIPPGPNAFPSVEAATLPSDLK